jgi:ubiquinone/menaquinone biosynthesis C-methylase UbiE
MIDKKKLQNWYNFQARFYSFWRDRYDAAIIKYISNRLNSIQTKHLMVLDVACGSGFFSIGISDKVQIPCSIVGFDYVHNFIKIAHNKAKLKGKTKPFFLISDAEKMPFSGCSFNLAIAGGLFPNLDSHDDLLEELARVLKPGSLFFIIEFSPQSNFWLKLYILILIMAFKIFSFFFQKFRFSSNWNYNNTYIDIKQLKRSLMRHGFNVVSTENKYNCIIIEAEKRYA